MPKAVFYGELSQGKRDRGAPRKRFKDQLKRQLTQADVSSVSPSSERIEGLWVTCSFYSRVGAMLLVVTWQREK